jgi:hypothetical protein
MSYRTEKMQKRIIPNQFSNEIISQLSSASLTCEGIEATLIALDSNIRGDRMSVDSESALIWSVCKQIEAVNAAITAACRTDGGPR